MIEKLLQMKNARLILGLALLIIVLSALFGLRSFESPVQNSEGKWAVNCTSAWQPMQLTFSSEFPLLKTIRCDVEAASRRYTIYFVAITTFSILAGGILVSERLRKKT